MTKQELKLERYKRQLSILNPEKHCDTLIAIVGCGAIGSCTAVCLAKLGFRNFNLYDFDKIEAHNLSNQFFMNSQLGKLKTSAVTELITAFGDEDCGVTECGKVDSKTVLFEPIVIVCTDSMKTRKLVYKKAQLSTDYLIDARMGGQMFRVYTVDMNDAASRKLYEKTLYSDSKAVELPCTERSIIFNLFGVASIIASNMTRLVTKKEYKKEILFDYVNMQLIAT